MLDKPQEMLARTRSFAMDIQLAAAFHACTKEARGPTAHPRFQPKMPEKPILGIGPGVTLCRVERLASFLPPKAGRKAFRGVGDVNPQNHRLSANWTLVVVATQRTVSALALNCSCRC